MTVEQARARVAELVECVRQAQAQRDTATDDAERRAAEAELRLQRAALEQARTDLVQLKRAARAQAQDVHDRELREMAARARADVDAVLSGAQALRRAVGLARARGLQTPREYAPLPDAAERQLEGWRRRLRALAGEAAPDYGDAA